MAKRPRSADLSALGREDAMLMKEMGLTYEIPGEGRYVVKTDLGKLAPLLLHIEDSFIIGR